jgi:hypothetical protein
LKNGDSIKLNDGNQFYFIAIECLLTMDIKQRDKPPHNQLQSMILQLQKITSNLASSETFANSFYLALDKFCLRNKILQIELNSMIAQL